MRRLPLLPHNALHGGNLRIYANGDLVGAEVGGAVKNVLAIATGICDGLGLGNNARAALITRGLVEITRFGEALGAKRETFMGLAGMGDLMLTCTGELSRNRRVGLLLAEGRALADVVRELGHVAEGVPGGARGRAPCRGAGHRHADHACRHRSTGWQDFAACRRRAIDGARGAPRVGLVAAGVALLAPGLIDHHRHRVGQVQAAVARESGAGAGVDLWVSPASKAGGRPLDSDPKTKASPG
jgi:hypothetical protein